MTIKRACIGLVLTSALAGCAASNHLVYVQEVSMGLNLAVGTEGTQKFSLGYDRDVYAIVPKKTNGEDTNDVMSLVSVNKASISSLSEMTVSEFVASGEPATELAKKPAAIEQLRSKIYGPGQ